MKNLLWLRLTICVCLVVVFCRYLFLYFYGYGLNDWDQHLFYYGSFLKSIVDYQQLPFWNPWYCGGNVLWQNPQIPLLSPTYLLALLMPLHMAMKINIVIHYVLALVGMNFVGRRVFHIRSFMVCLLGSSIFVFNSYFALQITEGHTWILPFAFIPFAFYFFHRALLYHQSKDIIYVSGILALMVFSSGIYPLFYLLLFFGLYLLIRMIQRPSFSLLKTFICIGLFSVALSCVKLLPVMMFSKEYPRVSSHQERVSPKTIPYILFGRHQSVHYQHPDQQWKWHEYGCFIGTSYFVLLLLAMFFCFRKPNPLSLLSVLGLVIFLVLYMGRFSEFSPYAMFDYLPFVRSLRVPGRALILGTFCMGLCLFHLLKIIERRLKNKRHFKAAMFLLLLVSVGDLFVVNSGIFSQAFSVPSNQVEHIHKKQPTFQVVRNLPHYGANSSLYKALLQNQSILDCYEPQKANLGYRFGKALVFATKHTHISHIKFRHNTVRFNIGVKREAQVFLNQNYVKGWRINLPQHTVQKRENLPMIQLKPGRYENVTFRFIPPYWHASLLISGLTFLFMIVIRFRK